MEVLVKLAERLDLRIELLGNEFARDGDCCLYVGYIKRLPLSGAPFCSRMGGDARSLGLASRKNSFCS